MARSRDVVENRRLLDGPKERRREMKMRPVRNAFTLIELLVVILVMALLAALLFRGIGAAMEMAKKTKAKTEVKGIAMALEAYYNEYHKWPPQASFDTTASITDPELNPVPISGDLAKMLQGDPALFAYNTKSIAFISFERFAGTNQPVNPWYQSGPFSTNNCYFYKVDKNFDNIISVGATPPPTSAIKRRVLVWTRNPNNGTLVMSSD